jgi:hypothetical protein
MAHGSSDTRVLAPRSRFYQGPFGRIFPNLDPWAPPGVADAEIQPHFVGVAGDMVEKPGQTPHQALESPNAHSDFNAAIPAGYTYFGQFIDHDITFDPASSLMRENDPEGLLNHRTPRFDLDCVYGRGPDDNPFLYDKTDTARFLIGAVPGTGLSDLPRNGQGVALIGDPRNDENVIVSQLQLAFLRAHNELVRRARDEQQAGAAAFEMARTTLRWLYQYIVWNDFVRRVTLPNVHAAALMLRTTPDGRSEWKTGLEDIYKWKNQPFIPVEFSVAAYRFGHSMVRNEYQTNAPHRGFNQFVPIFDNSDPANADPDDLRGFRPMTALNTIQWDWFLKMESSGGPFPQHARKIDTRLANALTALHIDPAGSSFNKLAFRNLLRGYRFGLPSGTSVARRLGINPVQVPPDRDALWFYILNEAEAGGGETLGPVGSIIVAATFAGLLKGDPKSWVNVRPTWTPDEDPLLKAADKKDGDFKPGGSDREWQLPAIIRLAGLPVKAGDFPQQQPQTVDV